MSGYSFDVDDDTLRIHPHDARAGFWLGQLVKELEASGVVVRYDAKGVVYVPLRRGK